MIPQSTTLAERLEFYEWALDRIKNSDRCIFICFLAREYYSFSDFEINNIKELFIELYNTRTNADDKILWNDYSKGVNEERIEALEKAIIEVKRKMGEV